MKYFLAAAFLLLTSLPSFAQQISYPEWQKEVDSNMRLLPKYGGQTKTEDLVKADAEFIATALKQLETPRKASDYMVKLGFDYLAKGDPKTAIYRFNQAWLLDPTNENVFWGFGGIYFYFKDHDKALDQYTEGLVLNPKSTNIMVDMATIGLARFNVSKDESDLTAPISLLKRAYDIDPTNQNLLFKLSISHFFKNDCPNAVKYYEECKKLGGKTLTPAYTAALQEKCIN